MWDKPERWEYSSSQIIRIVEPTIAQNPSQKQLHCFLRQGDAKKNIPHPNFYFDHQ